jgi:hypothetical protein
MRAIVGAMVEEEIVMMKRSVSLLALAMACAIPLAASAEGAIESRVPDQHTMQQTRPAQGADTAKLREVGDTQMNREAPARGGGEPAAATDARAQQLHRASPHIILVQSKLDAAQAEVRGIGRLASLEREPMSDMYRQHVRSFATDLQNDVNDARHHLEQLRSTVQSLQVSDAIRNDMQAADRALLQARSDLQRIDAIGRSNVPARPIPQPPQGQQPAIQARQFANFGDFGNAIAGDLDNAKAAIDRVERGLR